MRYVQPKILRTDNANLSIQSVAKPDNEKPVGLVAESFPGTLRTTPFGYEADE